MENNHTLKCCSGNFPTSSYTLRLLEKYQINIWMHGYSQIHGTRSKKDGELWDKSVPYFQQESGPCPLDWRIVLYATVNLVFFQQSLHIWICWKIARTTFQCMVVFQSRGQHFILVEISWSQDLRVELIYWILAEDSKMKIACTPKLPTIRGWKLNNKFDNLVYMYISYTHVIWRTQEEPAYRRL